MKDDPYNRKNGFHHFTVLKSAELLLRGTAQLTGMGIVYIILFSLLSCSRMFDTVSDDSTADAPSAACTLSVSLDGITGGAAPSCLTASGGKESSRSAFPALSDGVYKAKIWKSTGGTEGSVWTSSVSGDAPLTFLIDSAEAAEYNIRLGFFSSASDLTPAFYTTTPAAFTVTKGILKAYCTVSILPGNCTAGGGATTTGSIRLSLSPDDGITVSTVTMQNSEGTTVSVSYSSNTITGSTVPAGKYTLTILAADNAGNTFSPPAESVYVWPGMATNKWYTGSSSISDALTVSPSPRTWFCVSGSGGSLAAGDYTGDGGFARPFATVQAAVSHCTDTTVNGYTIYIDGTITLDSTISVEFSKKITFAGLNGTSTDIIDGGHTSTTTGSGHQILNIDSGSTVTIENLTLKNGYSSGNGGGLYNNGTLTVKNSIITSCYAEPGGGIYNDYLGNLTIADSTIKSCNHCGIYNNGGTFTMSGGTIGGTTDADKNWAPYGGGVYNKKYSDTYVGTFTINSGTISNNTATVNAGGIDNEGGKIYINGGTISGNNAEGTTGGGINNYSNGTITMTAGTVSGNTAATSGGGINLESGSFTMSGGTISGNTATGGCGGGVNLQAGEDVASGKTVTFTMTGGIITSNTATVNGGGVNVCSGSNTFNMSGCAVIDAETAGANDVYLPGGKYITVTGKLTPGSNTTLSSSGSKYSAEIAVPDTITDKTKVITGNASTYTYSNADASMFVINPKIINIVLFYSDNTTYAEAGITGVTLVSVNGGTASLQGRSVTLSNFNISKYETTYEIWYIVYQWAVVHGYTFANKGTEGKIDTASPTSEYNQPIEFVSWRDCIIWCNAYTEYTNAVFGSTLTYAYCTDSGYTTPLKTVDLTKTITTAEGSEDNPYYNTRATGYRLPTEAEWEWAARGGNPSDTTNWNYTYAGSDTINDVAWYYGNSGSTAPSHIVGTKAANRLELYDMSGNALEWCWDWYGTIGTTEDPNPTGPDTGDKRIQRGGNWYAEPTECKVSYRSTEENSNPPWSAWDTLGFRVCRTTE